MRPVRRRRPTKQQGTQKEPSPATTASLSVGGGKCFGTKSSLDYRMKHKHGKEKERVSHCSRPSSAEKQKGGPEQRKQDENETPGDIERNGRKASESRTVHRREMVRQLFL